MEAKGASGHLPPIPATSRLLPLRSPCLLKPFLHLSPTSSGSPTGQPPPRPLTPRLLHLRTIPWTHLQAPGPHTRPWLLRELRPRSTRAGAQLQAWGSDPAVECPHRHLPPGPRQLRTRPHLPAAVPGLGAALLPPCSVAGTRLSGTGAR